MGGDCLADVGLLRAEAGVYGQVEVASEATASCTVGALAAEAKASVRAIKRARAAAREWVWELAGEHSRATRPAREVPPQTVEASAIRSSDV